jgi:ParB family transcriptional regulator, chromosome partitioning protein
MTSGQILNVQLSKIRPGKNIRSSPLDTEQLAASIRERGLLHPIVVRTIDGSFEIVAGNRRFHACKNLGWKKITCHIVELNARQAYELSLIENLQRHSLNPLDEACAFKAYVSDFGWGGVSELSIKVGKSVSYITKRIKLLNLPDNVLNSLTNQTLDTSAAEELFSVKDKVKQSDLGKLIIDRRMSWRKTREFIKEHSANDIDCPSFYKSEYVDHIKTAERSFDKAITAVRIAMNSMGEIISYVEEDWVLYETLMQHKNMLHAQIDILLKEKRKL